MSDKEAEYYEQRAGLNEPAPEEPAARFDATPEVREQLAKRDDLQRQIAANKANVRMLLDAILRNLKQR